MEEKLFNQLINYINGFDYVQGDIRTYYPWFVDQLKNRWKEHYNSIIAAVNYSDVNCIDALSVRIEQVIRKENYPLIIKNGNGDYILLLDDDQWLGFTGSKFVLYYGDIVRSESSVVLPHISKLSTIIETEDIALLYWMAAYEALAKSWEHYNDVNGVLGLYVQRILLKEGFLTDRLYHSSVEGRIMSDGVDLVNYTRMGAQCMLATKGQDNLAYCALSVDTAHCLIGDTCYYIKTPILNAVYGGAYCAVGAQLIIGILLMKDLCVTGTVLNFIGDKHTKIPGRKSDILVAHSLEEIHDSLNFDFMRLMLSETIAEGVMHDC